MSVGNESGLVGAVGIDLRRMHETWMEVVFPRQRGAADTVLGKYKPKSQSGAIAYKVWSALGVPIVGVLYPLVLFGVILRFQARQLDNTAARLGIVGVVLVFGLLWGGLSALAKFELSLAAGGITAVVVASLTAVGSAALAAGLTRAGGRGTTVLLAYPLAMTAFFLPPVVAALYSPTVAEVVIPQSDSLARWLLANVLDFGGIRAFLVQNYERQGAAYAIMWLGISFPVGWLLGFFVTLANLVRPTAGED
jgi:hypothetical protein